MKITFKSLLTVMLLMLVSYTASATTIAEAQKLAAGDNCTISGTVVGTYARGMLVGDGTGYILYYLNAATTYVVGDQVTITGALKAYNGFNQFTSTATVTKTGTTSFTQPTATVLDGAAMDAYLKAPVIEYASMTGKLAVSGNYLNLTVDGATTAIGSLSYPNENYAAYNGKTVTVTGYTIGVSSSKYLNMMVVSLTSNETPVEPVYTKVDIATAAAGDATTNYEVDGTVCATYARGFLLNDATGSILVYTGTPTTYVVGDILNVKGTVSAYAGLNQFGSTSVITKTGSETFTYPAATVMDSAAVNAYLGSVSVKYATLNGVLSISKGTSTYYNLAIDGANATGSLAYPNDGLVPDSLDTKSVTATGFLIGVSGTSTKYVNMMLVSITSNGNGGGGGGGGETEEITGTNLLENGSFENWNDTVPVSWYTNSASNDSIVKSTIAKDGSLSVQLNGMSSNKRLSTKPYTIKAGKYAFAVHAKAVDGINAGSIRLGFVSYKEDGSVNSTAYNYQIDKTTVTSDWKQYSFEYTFPSDTVVSFVIMVSKGTETAFLADNALLVSKSGVEPTPNPGTPQTISTAIAAAAGDSCYVQGTVAANYAKGFLISDNTGSILVYTGKSSSLAVGTIVTVSDTIATRNGLNQFPASAVVTTVGVDASFAQPTAVAMDGAAMDAYLTAPTVKYVTYNGVLAVSGNYYNVVINGATTAIGSISYPIASYAGNDKDTIQVTGYLIGVSSSKYVNTMITDFKVTGDYQAEPVKTEGDGSKENPYTVNDVILLANSVAGPAWVTGKVGGTYANGGTITTTGWTLASNLALVDAKGQAIPVQLTAGTDARSAMNLVDNPALFGETVKVYGKLVAYFSVPGVKDVTDYDLSATGISNIEIPDPEVPKVNGESTTPDDGAPLFTLTGKMLASKCYLEVFNVVGQRIATVKAGGNTTLNRGVFMVKAAGKVTKLFVK